MSSEAQRIAIAEACGWRKEDTGGLLMRFRPWIHKGADGEDHKNWKTDAQLPDYLADLNAVHEAEETLSKDQRRQWEFCIADMFSASAGQSWFDVCHMTAAQRAEAFLKALGKWEEGK